MVHRNLIPLLGLPVALLSTGCEPCFGKTGEELETCEAEEEARRLAEEAAAADGGAPDADGAPGESPDDQDGDGSGSGSASDEPNVVYEGEPSAGPEWVRDNSEVTHSGETAVHPPMLNGGDEATFEFDCGGEEHTQLSFELYQQEGAAVLDFFVDGEQREVLLERYIAGYAERWKTLVFNVPRGTHTYRFTASSDVDVRPPYILDTFRCRDESPEAEPNGRVSFDEGFVPPTTSGDWHSGNLWGTHEGEAALYAPWMNGGDEASFTLDCDGRRHTQLSFQLYQRDGNASLELFVDGEKRDLLVESYIAGYAERWKHLVFNVPRGEHEYEFRVSTEQDVAPPYVLDTFVCHDEAPEPEPNGRISFDERFIPPSVSGDWYVGNLWGTHEGEAAIHSPWLAAGDEASFDVDCDGVEHTSLSFEFYQRETHGSVALDFFVDGELRRTLLEAEIEGYAERWKSLTFEDLPMGSHTYRFTARSEVDVTPPFILDTFVCD